MKSLIILFSLLGFPALCQQIYQVNEVEKPAEPKGGTAFLNQFIASNIQIPVKSAAKGLNARVFVKGIVEPDGSMSALEVVRSVDKGCDAEAVRLLSLYKAWQPALIKDKPVRQTTVFPVVFRTEPVPGFDSTENAIIEYFDKDKRSTGDPQKYKFRNFIPVDERGYVSGDIQYQEVRSGKWKTLVNIPFQKKEIWAQISGSAKVDSVKAFRTFAKTDHFDDPYEEAIFQTDGKLLSHAAYPGSGKPPVKNKSYYLSGMLFEEQERSDSISKMITWFDNGQIHSILNSGGKKGIAIKNVWERDGRQTVKDGNGWAKIKGNAYRQRAVSEEGKVENERKSGKWTGKFADSTLAFEEFFSGGVLEQGTSYFDGDKVTYENDFITEPQFNGGKDKMYKFLGENLRLPVGAPKARGRVVLSFVVQEDGHLGALKIEQSLSASVDNDGRWEPGTLGGRKISVRYRLPVNFE
jgi:hypothetical protein